MKIRYVSIGILLSLSCLINAYSLRDLGNTLNKGLGKFNHAMHEKSFKYAPLQSHDEKFVNSLLDQIKPQQDIKVYSCSSESSHAGGNRIYLIEPHRLKRLVIAYILN